MIENGIIVNNNKGIEIGTGGALFTYKAPPPGFNYTPTANTKVYLPLNTDALDKSGNGYSVTVDGPTNVTGGKFSQNCYRFDGGTGLNIIQVIGQPITTNGNWTMSVWFKRNGGGGYASLWCLGFGWTGGGNGMMNYWNCGSIDGLFPGVRWLPAGIFTGVSNGAWHNLIATADGSDVRWYLDGTVSAYVSGGLPATPTTYITLGAEGNQGSIPWTTTSNKMDGWYQELIVENKYWTATDVSNYYTPRA